MVVSIEIITLGNVSPLVIYIVFLFVVMRFVKLLLSVLLRHAFLAVMAHPLFLIAVKNVDLWTVDHVHLQLLWPVA